MPLLGLFGRKTHERAGFALYTEAVRAARNPFFYAELGVPDTMDGRFDMIGLYVFLLIHRLHSEGERGAALAQAVFDAMFSDMDFTLREMGVSDMSVGRRNKAMWEALHGRAQAYAGAVDAAAPGALAQAIARNVWRGAEPGPAAHSLAELALREHQLLAGQPLDALLRGRVAFLEPVSA